eukprot:11682801-Karenia_brevis.AAC.1
MIMWCPCMAASKLITSMPPRHVHADRHVHVHMAVLKLITLRLHTSMSPCHVHADRHVHVRIAVLRISPSNGATRCHLSLIHI